jgi:alpha-amylase
VDYELVNTSSKILITRFGVEFNLSLLAGRAPDRYYEIPDRLLADSQLASVGEEGSVQRLVLVDQWLGLKVCLDWSSPAILWRFPIETVSQSEKGLERIYQGSVVFPHWPLELSPSHPWRVQLIVAVEGL